MQVVDLPPGPAPLTARHAAANLAEHLAGFRAANGFAPDEPDHPAMLFLLEVHDRKRMSMKHFRRDACLHKKLFDKQVKLGHVHQLMAAAMGYKTLAAMQAASKGKEYVENISK